MKIAYVDAQSYAGGTANAVRVDAMVEALGLSGHEVVLYREPSGGSRPRRGGLAGVVPSAFFLGEGVDDWLDSLPDSPDLVLCYGVDPRYLSRVQKWCRRREVPLVIDIVDWYAPGDVAGVGPKLFALLNDRWAMRSLARRCDGAIVVSRLLEQHCVGLGLPTLRVPATISGLTTAPSVGDGSLTVTYAGAPGLREAAALTNLRRLARDGELSRLRVAVQVIGPSAPADFDASAEPGLRYLGRLPRVDTLRRVSESTFTVLQRPGDRRFAQAGFPSKVAESLLLGVPVIANLTGDLNDFLHDLGNSVVLAGEDYQALRDGFERAVAWAPSIDRDRIARTAETQFSPRGVQPRLADFLASIAGGGSDG